MALPNVKYDKLSRLNKDIKMSRDFYTGVSNVYREEYLPKWTRETDDGYAVRQANTPFVNLYQPIIDSLVGLTLQGNNEHKCLYDDNIDLQGHSLDRFLKLVLQDTIVAGATFVAVETTDDRSYLKIYKYEDLYSYKIEDGILKQIVFRDKAEEEVDEFAIQEVERYIVFKIGGGDVYYAKDGEELRKQDSWENRLDYIPIVGIFTGKKLGQLQYLPLFLDVAYLNKIHFNLESNIGNVLCVVGNPIPQFFGETSDKSITVGVQDALIFDDKTKQGLVYAEIDGKGVDKLQMKIDKLEQQIDKTTYTILVNTDSKTKIDAEENRAKNTSLLNTLAVELETKMVKVLQYMYDIENKKETAELELKKDFDKASINIDVAMKLLLAGEMSRETFYSVLKTGELPKDFDVKLEAEKLEV